MPPIRNAPRPTLAHGVLAAILLMGAPAPVQAQEPEPEAVSVGVGMLAIPPYQLYHGRVNLSHQKTNYGSTYTERVDHAVGVQASVSMPTGSGGAVGLGLYLAETESEGRYLGLAAGEKHRRDLLTLGMDAGWKPALLSGGATTLRIPFGPSLLWQRLRLSEGHRDVHGSPHLDTTAPAVDWSDRKWLSFGGYGGLALTVQLGDHLALTSSALARFLYIPQSAWSGTEEEDIRRSTGRTVHVTYKDPIVYYGSGSITLEWRPG